MSKDKNKVVTVKLENGQEKKIMVKRPQGPVLNEAQRVGAKVWTDCIKDGIMTKQELGMLMKEKGIWGVKQEKEQSRLNQEIANLEKQLYINKNKKIKKSEAKKIAIEMRVKRNELRDLISERIGLEQNTAESLSDNAKFDFMVSQCTYDESGNNKIFKSLEEYNDQSDSPIAFSAASALAELVYSLDKDFESSLPENKFLITQKMVNDNLALVNSEGHTVDVDGRLINEDGYYINADNKRVDRDGNLLDEDGNYVPTVEYIDDEAPAKEQNSVSNNKDEASEGSQETNKAEDTVSK